MNEGPGLLEILEQFTHVFEGFTVELVQHVGKDIYQIVLYEGELPQLKKNRRRELRKTAYVALDQETNIFVISMRTETDVPTEGYGWLLMYANLLHEFDTRYICQIHVPTPFPEDARDEPLYIECNWKVRLGEGRGLDVMLLLREAFETVYEEVATARHEINKNWHDVGKA